MRSERACIPIYAIDEEVDRAANTGDWPRISICIMLFVRADAY
jgi:hypothetical protein